MLHPIRYAVFDGVDDYTLSLDKIGPVWRITIYNVIDCESDETDYEFFLLPEQAVLRWVALCQEHAYIGTGVNSFEHTMSVLFGVEDA